MQSKVSSMTSIVASGFLWTSNINLNIFLKFKKIVINFTFTETKYPWKNEEHLCNRLCSFSHYCCYQRLKLFAVSTFATNVSSRISLGMQRWVDNWYMWMLCCVCQSNWGEVWPRNFYSGGQMWLWLEMQKTECQCWRNMWP